jgi:hypothetical protein
VLLPPVEAWAVATLERLLLQQEAAGGSGKGSAAGALTLPVQDEAAAGQQEQQEEEETRQGSGCHMLVDIQPGWRAAANASQQLLVLAAVLHPAAAPSTAAEPAAAAEQADDPDPLGLRHPITQVLGALSPLQLADTLHALSRRAPAAMNALLTRALPPACAQLVTQKLEEAQQLLAAGGDDHSEQEADAAAVAGGSTKDRQLLTCGSLHEVYSSMYGEEVGADPDVVLGQLLRGKLRLAAAVAKALLPDPAAVDS